MRPSEEWGRARYHSEADRSAAPGSALSSGPHCLVVVHWWDSGIELPGHAQVF